MVNAFIYVNVCYVDFVRRNKVLRNKCCQVVADALHCRRRTVGQNLLIDDAKNYGIQMRIVQMNLLASILTGHKRKNRMKEQGNFIIVTKTKMNDRKIGQ